MCSRNGELLFVDFQLEGAAPKPSSSGAAAPFAAPATGREKAEQATRPKVDLSKVQEEEGQSPKSSYLQSVEQGSVPGGEMVELTLRLVRRSVLAVDVFYKTQPGMIPRERDGKMCRHGDKGMCDYCMPLEVSRSQQRADSLPRRAHHPPLLPPPVFISSSSSFHRHLLLWSPCCSR